MSNSNENTLSHVSIGTTDIGHAQTFYDEVLKTVGCTRLHTYPLSIGYGKSFPEFWVQTPIDGLPAHVGNGTHIAFMADSTDDVHAFYNAALKNGGTCDGKPGPRPDYGPAYYGCFVRDLDGHKIEATYWDIKKMEDAEGQA